MADDADFAAEEEQKHQESSLNMARRVAAVIPKGQSGECRNCGEWYERIVNGHCARCRDELHLA